MKLVINKCYGGFGLSDKAIEMIMKRKGLGCYRYKQTKYSFESGINEYIRCEEFDENTLFTYYQTEDLGEKVNNLPSETCWYYGNLERNDEDLIAVVEELGEEADGRFANLRIVDIPDDIEWELEYYDGVETVHELHRSW